VWFEREGRRVSTLDLLDGRFVLLTGAGSRWAEAARSAADQLGGKLAIFQVGTVGDLLEAESGWSVRLGVTPGGAVLVRPDGFVAWRSNATGDSTAGSVLTEVLSSILGKPATT
jgi:hypothetical protein